jgi:hypothetical protein
VVDDAYVVIGTSFAIAHMNAMSSRAIAVTATFGMLAAHGEPAKALAQPHLRFPPDVLNRFGQRVDASLDVLGHFGRMPMRPGAFDQGAPGAAVPGLRDGAEPAPRAAGVLRRHEPDERGQLSWGVEAREVAEFGDHGDRDEELDAA